MCRSCVSLMCLHICAHMTWSRLSAASCFEWCRPHRQNTGAQWSLQLVCVYVCAIASRTDGKHVRSPWGGALLGGGLLWGPSRPLYLFARTEVADAGRPGQLCLANGRRNTPDGQISRMGALNVGQIPSIGALNVRGREARRWKVALPVRMSCCRSTSLRAQTYQRCSRWPPMQMGAQR